MNLLFAIDERCIDQLSMTLRSILRCDENAHYEVYILESDLKQETKKAISNISESLSFHFIQVDKDIFKGFMTTSRYPETIYYRLIAPLVLPEDVDRILYLDVDIIVINKLDELYNMDFEG
ncbi:MAG: glycosyltransferase family 8 protein, partial [Erysipelotrichaceae bacterium]